MREYVQTDLDVAYIIGEGKISKKIAAIKEFKKPYELHLSAGLPLSKDVNDTLWRMLFHLKNMLEFQKMFERYSGYYLSHKDDSVFPDDWEVVEYLIENYVSIMKSALYGKHTRYLPLLNHSRDTMILNVRNN